MYLYGAGGHARVIRDIVELSGGVIEGFIDDDCLLKEKDGLPVIHEVPSGCDLILAIGDSSARYELAKRLERLNVSFCTAIHPNAIISPYAKIGEGSVIMPGVVVNAFVEIGKHCVINTCSSVDHETIIGDYANICPHTVICGQCVVGVGTNVCAGSVVIQSMKIGDWSIVGAGSLVRHNVSSGVVVVGDDCHEIRKNKVLK